MADSEEQEKKPVSIALKTGTAVDVQFSSDEDDDDEAPTESNKVVYTPAPLSAPPIVERVALKPTFIAPPAAEPPAQMDFEAALSMLKKNKKQKQVEKAEAAHQHDDDDDDDYALEPNNDEDGFETITTSSGRTFRSKIQTKEEEIEQSGEDEAEEEETIDFGQEIEIGDLRGLEEDDRMIIARPKEESTVEADGEDDEQIEFGENNESEDDSEFVAGVRIKLMSKAELPQSMIEEAGMKKLDNIEVPTSPLPEVVNQSDDDDDEEEREKSKIEQKLDSIPPPPSGDQSGLQEHWEWEEPSPMQIPPQEPDSESIVSSEIYSPPPKPKAKTKQEPKLIELQKSLADKLLDAFNEEEFIQEELKDIRQMNKEKYLAEKAVMSEERKQQAAKAATPKPKRKSVGFAEELEETNEDQEANEPKEENAYLPDAKPKPILKSSSTFDEALHGSSFNTPRTPRKVTENKTGDNEESDESEDEEEDETDDEEEEESSEAEDEDEEEDAYEDDIFSGKSELAGKSIKKKYIQPGVPIHPNTEGRVIFKLRDPDPQMVAAWRREFRDCGEVVISCGETLTEEKWDCVMMPMTNSFGWVDVDPEKAFTDVAKIQDAETSLPAKIQLEHFGELLVGQSILLSGKKDRNKNCRFVCASPIMRVPMMIAQSVNPYLAMRSCIQHIRQYNMTTREPQRIRTVLIPGLGHTSIGRMPHYRVAHQMRKAYDLFALEQNVALAAGTEPGKVVTFHVQMNQYKLGHKV